MDEAQDTFDRRYGKRLLDLAMAVPAMLCLGALDAAGDLVRLKLIAVFFTQQRPGLHGRLFRSASSER